MLANAEANYRRLILSTRHAANLAANGDLPEIQVDQARQDELDARDSWVAAQQSYKQRLDEFKLVLGLPTDAAITLDPGELQRLWEFAKEALQLQADNDQSAAASANVKDNGRQRAEQVDADAPVELVPPDPTAGGPMEMAESKAIPLALQERLDLRVVVGRVFDAQRQAAVAADDLRADLTLFGRAKIAERRNLAGGDRSNGNFHADRGAYSVLASLDLPLERTSERNVYRGSLIDLEQRVRDVQQVEDQIKLELRSALRDLLENRERICIQSEAVTLARRRVASTEALLRVGRAEVRDVLESQEALLEAEDSLTSALVNYRVAELDLQRDLGVLQVDEQGLRTEYDPETPETPETK